MKLKCFGLSLFKNNNFFFILSKNKMKKLGQNETKGKK